jgi:hypothetical protein
LNRSISGEPSPSIQGSLRNRLFESIFKRQISGEFVLAGAETDAKYRLDNAVQPDFLFTTEDITASLEMKISAKSSVTQVLKYGLLALAVEEDRGKKMEHVLAFLGPDTFSRLWAKGFASVDDLKMQVEVERSTCFRRLSGKAKRFREHESRYFEILSSLSIEFISYRSLADFLEAEISPSDESMGAQVYRNLVVGMVEEMKVRGLA